MNLYIPNQGQVIAHYGETVQSMIHMEECAELIQAISKMRRGENEQTRDNLIEELADVLICIEQIKLMYSISETQLQEMIFRKYARQEARMYGNERAAIKG